MAMSRDLGAGSAVTIDQWRTLRCLFDAALNVAADARADWCEQACAGDAQMLALLRRLLYRDDAMARLSAAALWPWARL